MLFDKWKWLRRRCRLFSIISWTLVNPLRELCPTVVLLIFVITCHQFSLACGPGSGAGSGLNGGGAIGRDKLLAQSVDSENDVAAELGDQQPVSNVDQWIPANFKRASDQEIISVLNPNLRSTIGDVVVKPFNSGSVSVQPIVCPSDLSCDFSNWRLCRWRNSKDDELNFYVGEGAIEEDRLQLYTGTRITPNSPFILTAANRGDYKSWLVSDIIPEQPSDGTVEFRYWLTPLVELRVCTRNVDAPQPMSCSDSLGSSSSPGPVVVAIPGPIREPFEIIFEVMNFVSDPGGLAFVDDIIYSSTLCGEVSATATTSSATKLVLKPKNRVEQRQETTLSICDAVPCSFDDDAACGYSRFGPGATLSWLIAHGPVGNKATGIQRDVYGIANSTNQYLLASGERRGLKDMFVAQSQPFRLDRPISVHFYRHMHSSTSQLGVCLFVSSTTVCPATFRIDVEALDWRESIVDFGPVDIPMGLKNKPITLLFVAQGLKQNNFIGVDNIEVRERNGSPAC